MYAQFCLRSNDPSLSADDIDVAKLPQDIQGLYEEKRNIKGRVQLSLAGSYELLDGTGTSGEAVGKTKKQNIECFGEKKLTFFGAWDNLIKRGFFNFYEWRQLH